MRRIAPLLVSLTILAAIYWSLDVDSLFAVFRGSSVPWLLAGFLMFILPAILTAERLRLLAPEQARIGPVEALRLVLAASSLNMVLPSKMGDLAKAWFIADRGSTDRSLALSLVLYEKACDLLSILAWCILGLILYPVEVGWKFPALLATSVLAVACFTLMASRTAASACVILLKAVTPGRWTGSMIRLSESWFTMQRYVNSRWAKGLRVGAVSLLNSFAHLAHIWFFVIALQIEISFAVYLAAMPLAVLAGLVPFAFAGAGTRDAAIIFFFAPWLAIETAAALGVLCTARYVAPALSGLPFLRAYLSTIRGPRPGSADGAG